MTNRVTAEELQEFFTAKDSEQSLGEFALFGNVKTESDTEARLRSSWEDQ